MDFAQRLMQPTHKRHNSSRLSIFKESARASLGRRTFREEGLKMVNLTLIAVLGMAMFLFQESLEKIAHIELPGPKGQRFDYLTVDSEDHYLLSAHLGPGILYVIDMRTNKLVKAIPGLPGLTGLEYVPGLHKVYTSNWGEEKIGVVDLRTMSVIKRLPTESKPNGIAYAEPFQKVYVANTLGKAVR